MKRLLDVALSLVALVLFFIPSVIIAIVLVFKEKHPVFFRQPRIGKNKQVFEILKFQTMVDGIPTPTGTLLRATGIDEIPQFINVLRGDMSIVGPRALTSNDILRLGWDDDFHARRWDSKPGITGLAQLYGGQHRKTSWFWDNYYLHHHSHLLDLGIIAASFLMNLLGKTRVRRIIFQKNYLR